MSSMSDRSMARAREEMKKRGLLGFTSKAFKVFVSKFIYRRSCILFYGAPSGHVCEKAAPRLENVKFREGGYDDMVRFRYPEGDDAKRAFLAVVKSRFEDGDRCFISEHDGEVVNMIWVREKPVIAITEVGTDVEVGDNTICYFDGITLPEYWGYNILTYSNYNVMEVFREKRKVVYCYDDNIGSIKVIAKMGFKPLKKYYQLRLLGLKFRWARDWTGD
jgi:RimJ/RimL family protein N-acetyltransferase